jgi:hypothetical protein
VTHTYQQTGETATDAVFTCVTCGNVLGFNKPGIGFPTAVPNGDGTYSTPENPDQWSNAPCTE